MTNKKSDIGLIGLAVMGQNLALNIADHGFQISVYNRTESKTKQFAANNGNTPGGMVATSTLGTLVDSLSKPRKIIIMVKAGAATDAVIEEIAELLDAGDIVIDGGTQNGPIPFAANKPYRLEDYGLLEVVLAAVKKAHALGLV